MSESPNRHLHDLVIGYSATQSVYVATKLGIFEHIGAGRATSRELAAATDSNEQSLHQLMRFLAGLGIVQGDDRIGFSLTATGELLNESSIRDYVILHGEEFYQAWGNLLHNIRTGRPAFEHTLGAPMYQYFQSHPNTARRFDSAMSAGSTFFADLPAAHDFSDARTVVDVAGGTGGLLCSVLNANPHMTGVLFDLGHVIEEAQHAVARHDVANRVSFVKGDYTETMPTGGDVYLLSRILHHHTDAFNADLLERCREAMNPGGRVIILERMIPPTGSTSLGLWSDVHMMVLVGGRERTEQEYAELLDRSGLSMQDVQALSLDMFAIAATRQ